MEKLPKSDPVSAKGALSLRQQEILELVAQGLTSKEIGRQLSTSPSTVDNHVKAAVDRLGARNRQDAARLIAVTKEPPHNGEPASTITQSHPFALSRLPPLGGSRNQLPKGQRLLRIGQIAVLAIVGVSAAILTIVGLVHILSR